MNVCMKALLAFVCLAFSISAFAQYKIVAPSADLKYLLSFRRIGDNYYARKAGSKYTYYTLDKNFKTLKAATDRPVDDTREFRLGNNMYLLTVEEDKKKGTLNFYYATYQEPTKVTLLKSVNLKIYNETKFFDAYKEQFTGTEIVNTVSNLNFRKLYKVGSTADYQHLVITWLNPDSVYTLNYDVTVYDKDFKAVKEQKVLTEGTFSFHKGEAVSTDHKGNIYLLKHSPGFDEFDFARYNFKTGETVSKRWKIERIEGRPEMVYKVADVKVDTLSGNTYVLFLLPFEQPPYSMGVTGANTKLDVAYVDVYNGNGELVKRDSIKLSKADSDSLKLKDDAGNPVPLNMAYPDEGGIYLYNNGNYAIHLQFVNYKSAPLTADYGITTQTQADASSSYYSHSSNNMLARVYNNKHEQIKEYNIYRRRVNDYSGQAKDGNNEYWFFYTPPLTVYNPRESEKGMLYACYIDAAGEMHQVKIEGGKFIQGDASLRVYYSDPMEGLPVMDDDTHQTVFIRKQ